MRQSGAFAFLLFLLSSGAAQAERGTLCVQTFNVYATAYASNVGGRLAQLSESLLREPCDAIQLQELWRESNYTQFVKSMAPAGMAALRADAIRGDKAIIGLASLAKGSFGAAKSEVYAVNNEDGFLDWVRDLSGVQKGFSLLSAKITGLPQSITLINTHTHPTNEAIRAAQMVQLADAVLNRFPELAAQPMLFAADTNATPESLDNEILRKVLRLEDSFLAANGTYAGLCTYCSKNPLSWDSKDRVIDFVMFRDAPTFALRAEKSEINLKGSERAPLSDHYGVRWQFGWEDRPDAPLAIDSDSVRARRTDAALVMGKAAALLEQQRKAVYKKSAAKARELEAMFRGGNLSPAAEIIFRLP